MAARLSPHSRALFESMPLAFKYELLLERDPHGNVQVGRAATAFFCSFPPRISVLDGKSSWDARSATRTAMCRWAAAAIFCKFFLPLHFSVER